MNIVENTYFEDIYQILQGRLRSAPDVHVGEWQAIKSDSMPQGDTIELEDVSFETQLPNNKTDWQLFVKPNLPWAEDHFLERVSGEPLNPPPSSAWWPYAQKNNSEFKADEKFSHTYPERFWPKSIIGNLQTPDGLEDMVGIRYPWGDLLDVVHLLRNRPGTRQAYLPVWFPEDTGALEDQRVPCSLGYHFLLRNGELKVVYYIRSCDLFRHFRDDVYMAGRLCQWVAEGIFARPGRLVMHISSLHVFSAERPLL